ncbi:hypothetical protein SB847_21000, partial [Bacillus sp. SIMBA_026]|uniref:hypothetical protein n=1 Tax=Bacillus sp. SIMBA_026 TaxID=3085769 RepID=UPI00397E8414
MLSLRIPDLGGQNRYVHEISPNLAIEERFDAVRGTFSSTLIERSDDGQAIAEYSVTTHLLTESDLRTELREAGLV